MAATHVKLKTRPSSGKLPPRMIVVCVDEDVVAEVLKELRADGYSCSWRAAALRDGAAIADIFMVTARRGAP